MSSGCDERRQALDRAVRALAGRDHSAASLRAKLERAGVLERACDEAVDALVRDGYVDDARFATARAEHLAGRGYGDDWIRADLAVQGVAREVIADALATLAPEPDRACRHARRLGGGARAALRLARRGFGEDALAPLLAEAVAEEP